MQLKEFEKVEGYESDEDYINLKAFKDNKGFVFLTKTEEKFKCSSVCKPGLFYI